MLALLVISATALFILIVMRPSWGAYLFLFLNPLIVGFERGGLIDLVRPNELLLLLVLSALALRMLLLTMIKQVWTFRFDRVDLAVLLLTLFGSVVPLLLRLLRGLPTTQDDILYALVLPKYLLLFWAFRYAIRSERQVLFCLNTALASACIVALIGMFQVTQLFGVPEMLHAYYQHPFEGNSNMITSRGTSTLGSSFGYADVMIMSFLISIAMFQMGRSNRTLMAIAAIVFVGGVFAAGAFSGVIGFLVAATVFGLSFGYLGRMMALAVPGIIAAAVAFWPVIEYRLSGFSSPSGLPRSWTGRLENITVHFMPEILASWNWLVGVRPAPRLPAPESWRTFIYLESGYLWLVWIGGIPFLLAFLYFAWTVMSHYLGVLRMRQDAIGVAATAAFTYMAGLLVLMLLDPHLTVRGSADLFFPLMALALTQAPVLARVTQRELFPRSYPRATLLQPLGQAEAGGTS